MHVTWHYQCQRAKALYFDYEKKLKFVKYHLINTVSFNIHKIFYTL